MLTINHCVNEINKFLFNLCNYEETSKTELINFLNNYVNYILLYNDLPAEDITAQLHFVHKKHLNYEEPEYSLKLKHKKKHRQRNKENAKKEAYKKGLSTLTYMSGYSATNSFDIYLNEALCNINSLEQIYNLIELIYNIGHEVEHIVQTYKYTELWNTIELYNNKKLNAFDESVKLNNDNKKFLRKLSEKFQKHSDNYNILNSTEILADQNSCYYFNSLYSRIIKKEQEEDFFAFITYIYNGVNALHYERETDYTLWQEHDNLITKSLIERFGIAPEALNII